MASGQGLNTTFGQNRIQHKTKKWQTVSAQDITIMYYGDYAKDLANLVLLKTIEELPKIQTTMGYNLSQGIHLILYNSLYDYNHSNLELIDPKFYSGGLTIIPKNQSAIYFKGDRQNLISQIKKGISRIVFNEMIFGGNIAERIRSSSSVSLPIWYSEGLANYLAFGWGTDLDNEFRDALKVNKLNNYSNLVGEDAIFNGTLFWKYCIEKYGKDVVATMLYNTKYTRSVESSIYYISGQKTSTFIKSIKTYYADKYNADVINTNLPSNSSLTNKKNAHKKHTKLKISPDGKNILSVVNNKGRYMLVLYNILKNESKTIYSGGRKILNQVPDYDLPVVGFQDANTICLVSYSKGELVLKLLSFEGKVINTIKPKSLQHVKEIDFYKDQIILTAVKNNQTDLFYASTLKANFVNITNNINDEKGASFSHNGQKLIYVVSGLDSQAHKNSSIMSIELKNKKESKKLLTSSIEEFRQAKLLNKDRLVFLSDKNGIFNQYLLNINDTKTSKALTNYSSSILTQDLSDNGYFLSEMLLVNGTYKIFNYDLGVDGLIEPVKDPLKPTYYLKSIKAKQQINVVDSNVKDPINKPSKYTFYSGFDSTDTEVFEEDQILNNNNKSPIFTENEQYSPRFSLDYAVSGFNNSHLLSYYYLMDAKGRFTDPLFSNILFQASLSDRLKDYSLSAGFRVPFTADGTEFFVKGGYYAQRIDHKFSTFRRSIFLNNEVDYQRYITSFISYTPSFAFSENSRIEADLSYRSDNLNPLGFDLERLLEKPKNEQLLGYRFNFVFDNSISTGRNSLVGFRMKTGIENKIGLNKKRSLSTIYLDARWYKNIFRNINFATRMASAYSLGSDKIVYYMGGVENWIGAKYNEGSDIALTGNQYLFRSDVANMRGFKKGMRIGNHYIVSNNEIRIPYYGLIKKTPSNSEFVKNLSAIFFADIGAAWTEKSPYSEGNPYNTEYISIPSMDIKVVANRDPFIYSYGVGVRSKFLGYFIRYDLGWGVVERKVNKPIGHFSLGFDF